MPAGRGHRFADQYQLDPHGYHALCQALDRRRRELEGQMNISTETAFAFLLEPAPERGLENGPMGCSAGYDTLNVGSDGTAYPCPFLRDFPLGNLMIQSLRDFWKSSPGPQSLRGLQKEDLGEPCRSCSYAPSKCRGGCRTATYLAGGDLLAADPTCFRSLVA
jgi:radical SAM protein with 4Fe4S-binding SPASM domain